MPGSWHLITLVVCEPDLGREVLMSVTLVLPLSFLIVPLAKPV
jgi:hypothetical protein